MGMNKDLLTEYATNFGKNLKDFSKSLKDFHKNTPGAEVEESLEILAQKQKEITLAARKYYNAAEIDPAVIALINTTLIDKGLDGLKDFNKLLNVLIKNTEKELAEHIKKFKSDPEKNSHLEPIIENDLHKLKVLKEAGVIVNGSTAQTVRRNLALAAGKIAGGLYGATSAVICITMMTVAVAVAGVAASAYYGAMDGNVAKGAAYGTAAAIFAVPIALAISVFVYTKVNQAFESKDNKQGFLAKVINEAMTAFDSAEKADAQLKSNSKFAPKSNERDLKL